MLIPENALPGEIAELFNVSRESLSMLLSYSALLEKWQKQINLVASSTVPILWTRHIADSLQLISFMPKQTTEIVDVGSGAGIPGLVIALANGSGSAVRMHLIEPNSKKAAFLREAIRITGARAIVYEARATDVDSEAICNGNTVVISRAVTSLNNLFALIKPFMHRDAIALLHKGQNVDRELTESTKCWSMEMAKFPSKIRRHSFILEIRNLRRVTETPNGR